MRVVVIPEWGGKIASLVDLRRGQEWLYTNPNIKPRRPEYGASYVQDFDIGGFDECFPTVGACNYPSGPWKGVPIPDHGEVWSSPWESAPAEGGVRLAVKGRALPYKLEKSIRLLGDGRVRMEYRAENLSSDPMPFVWSSHPLLNIKPGMTLSVPARFMRVDSAPAFPAKSGDTLSWPRFEGLDLGLIAEREAGMAVKLYSQSLEEGWAELSDPNDGASIRFEFDPGQVTHVGLWLNYGGWAGVPGAAPYFNLGLEPCIGDSDSLEASVARSGAHAVLPPRGTREWWIELRLS
ncbi:MAG: hypothetical protein HYT87_09670 [Nitrospirae bacterium]|nr:hypothetical protein [Nitrospirota bacterium]